MAEDPVWACRCGVRVLPYEERCTWPVGRLLVQRSTIYIQFIGVGRVRRGPSTMTAWSDQAIQAGEVVDAIDERGWITSIRLVVNNERSRINGADEHIRVYGPHVRRVLEQVIGLPPIVAAPRT